MQTLQLALQLLWPQMSCAAHFQENLLVFRRHGGDLRDFTSPTLGFETLFSGFLVAARQTCIAILLVHFDPQTAREAFLRNRSSWLFGSCFLPKLYEQLCSLGWKAVTNPQ